METYYKIYYSSNLDEVSDAPVFVMLANEEKYGIAFHPQTDEETVRALSVAIGARIQAYSGGDEKILPAEMLEKIVYNMMFIKCSDEDEAFDTWEDASAEAEKFLKAFSYPHQEWKFELVEPVFPKNPDNDNETEEK